MHLSALFRYPIKSCRGIALNEAQVGRRGIAQDRAYLVVDEHDAFVTQRDHPRMALIDVAVSADALVVSAPGQHRLTLPARRDGEARRVTIWGDQVKALDQGPEAAAWFSAVMGFPAWLVGIADDAQRRLDPRFAVSADDETAFADGYPALVVTASALDALNDRLIAAGSEGVKMNRFRPNLVISGAPPFAEDGWKRLRVGEMVFRLVKPCARCVMTTNDQDTAERGVEPLRTLATFRTINQKVIFGQNAIPEAPGMLRVGDPVEVLA